MIKEIDITVFILIAEIILLLTILILLILYIRKQNQKKEIRFQTQNQLRNAVLKENLENKYAKEKVQTETERHVAYQVNYHDAIQQLGKKGCLQLIEHGKLSTRKYILEIDCVASVGKGKQNDIVLEDPNVDEVEIQLIWQDGKAYVKKVGYATRTFLERKRKKYIVSSDPIALNDGDMVVVGETKLEIRNIK